MCPRLQSFRDRSMSSVIPWASPLAQYRAHQAPIQSAIDRVLDSGTYILGAEVEAFESAFAEYCGGGHAVGVASGTDALILALKALGIGPGDEVITVSHTAVATVAAILAVGATPVLVDVDEVYLTLDPAALDRAATPRSKAVIAVHLYGQAADLDPILSFARERKLALIEDCAQACGGRYRGRRLGSIGDIGCFSFYPTKNLGAIGDGGMVLTREPKIAERVRRLRQYGWDDGRQTRETWTQFAARSASGGDSARKAAASGRRQCAARVDCAALRAWSSRIAARDAEGARRRATRVSSLRRRVRAARRTDGVSC